jgi:glycosidase
MRYFIRSFPTDLRKAIGLRHLQHCNPGIPNQLFTVIKGGDLFGIIENLEYLKSLGVNAILSESHFSGGLIPPL